MAERAGNQAVYAAADAPEAALPGSWERVVGRAEDTAVSHGRAILLLDEAHLLAGWASHLKGAWDRFRRKKTPVQGAFPMREDVPRWSAYVRDVFGVAASSPAQIVSLQKLQGQLQDSGALETVAHYLALLQEAFLVAPLPKYSTRVARRRASPPKLVTLNNALLAVMDPQGIVSSTSDPSRFGTWVENACLAHAWNSGQSVSYWREEPLEVDGVLEGSWGKWAVEVKTGKFQMKDLTGLLEFTRRHPAFKPLVICSAGGLATAERAEIAAIAWQEFLLAGPPGIALLGK